MFVLAVSGIDRFNALLIGEVFGTWRNIFAASQFGLKGLALLFRRDFEQTMRNIHDRIGSIESKPTHPQNTGAGRIPAGESKLVNRYCWSKCFVNMVISMLHGGTVLGVKYRTTQRCALCVQCIHKATLRYIPSDEVHLGHECIH